MAKLTLDCGCQNGHTYEQSNFIKKVIALAETYGEVTFQTKEVGVYGHDHKDTYTSEALNLTITSMRDSS